MDHIHRPDTIASHDNKHELEEIYVETILETLDNYKSAIEHNQLVRMIEYERTALKRQMPRCCSPSDSQTESTEKRNLDDC